MKKMIVMLLIAVFALSATAFAATYRHDDDITFEYDENAIEIISEEHRDDVDNIVMGFKDSAWGNGYISIVRRELPDGTPYPTCEEIAGELGVAQLETLPTWGHFKDVFTASITTNDVTETTFIAPVIDDDGEAEEMVTVTIGVTSLADEDAAMARDDAISAIVDTLRVDD